MTAQEINVGNVFGQATVLNHFGYVNKGVQTDIALVDHADSNSRLYQFQGGKANDMTGRIPAGKSAAEVYAECLAAAQGKAESVAVFVG